MELEVIIGLEIHVQLKTDSKMFCSCCNDSENTEPNRNVCPTCMALVGTLPLINRKAFEFTVITGLALNCSIAKHTKWDRKNYFYPDLPKAYQISQFDMPLAYDGALEVLSDHTFREIRINRVHLEEDAAKLIHRGDETFIDFNRAGTPLIEIVTEPDIRSAEEAESMLYELRRMVRYLGVSDADMEKGHLRCDASISLRPKGENKLYPRTEIKNLNSIRMVGKALQYEIAKQKKNWSPESRKGETTVLWDDERKETIFMRDKEGAADYRYFPEPDIPEIDMSSKTITKLKENIPVLPVERVKKYLEMGMYKDTSLAIVEDKNLSDFFERSVALANGDKELIKLIIKWFMGELFTVLKNIDLDSLDLSSDDFFALIDAVYRKEISRLTAKGLFERVCAGEITVLDGLKQPHDKTNDVELKAIVKKVLHENESIVEEYKGGKEKVINVLIGKIIKETGETVAAASILKELKQLL